MMQYFLVINQVVVKSTNIVLNYRLLKSTSFLPSTRVMYVQMLFLVLHDILVLVAWDKQVKITLYILC